MGKKEKDIKTNAVRMVEAHGIPYELRTYDGSHGFVDGVTAARETGIEEERCFKTLVLVGHSRQHYVCVIPVARELDLKKAARHFGEKNMEMIHAKDITKITGYIKGGCSPVGMKKPFPTAIDATAVSFAEIGVSGGKIGLQMELPPHELAALVNAEFADLTKKERPEEVR
jgi:Cys-tRNA(Pro)/Cys-tRNA(Cys) deacylase